MKKITVRWLKSIEACSSLEEMKQAEKIGCIFKIAIELKKQKRLTDLNWLLSRYMNKKQCVESAIFAANQVLKYYEKKYPNDNRPRLAIEAASKWLKNPTSKNKNAAAYAAHAANVAYAAAYAADAAYAAYAAASAAAYAADAADAASAAAYAVHAADVADVAYVVKNKMKLKIINIGIKILRRDNS